MRHYASSGGQRSKVGGFKQKFKEVTTGVYSQTSVSSQLYLAEQQRVLREGRRGRVGGGGYGGGGAGLPASHSMAELAGRDERRSQGLAMSRSLPALPGIVDVPTVAPAGGEQSLSGTDESTGPAPFLASADQMVMGGVRRRRAQRKPWRADPRCNPESRFFEPPNIEHLLRAEEL